MWYHMSVMSDTVLDLGTIKLFMHDLEFHLVFVCKRMQDHYKTIKQFRFITWLLS